MKTSSFHVYKGLGRISIARYAPRGTPAGFRIFPGLMPGKWFNSVPQAKYRELYFAALAQLDPQTVWDQLHAMHPDVEPVLLCWEKPPFTETNWCHRRMVAHWFSDKLGIEVPELEL